VRSPYGKSESIQDGKGGGRSLGIGSTVSPMTQDVKGEVL